MKKIFFLFLTFFICTEIFSQNTKKEKNFPPAYSAEASKLFADSLFNDGFFSDAASEYKRFLFLTEHDPGEKTEVIFKLSDIYNAENFSEGIFDLYSKFYSDNDDAQSLCLKLLNSKFLFSNSDTTVLSTISQTSAPLQIPDSAQTFTPAQTRACSIDSIIQISNFVLQKDFSSAKDIALKAEQLNDSFSEVSQLLNSYRYKSPVLAGTLSALIPGAGKIYIGNWIKGISSLLSISAFAGASVYCGYKYSIQNWRPWTYGSIAAILYAVNIYGSTQDAIRVNNANYENIYSATLNTYDILWTEFKDSFYEVKK